jgi:hypothetical protein
MIGELLPLLEGWRYAVYNTLSPVAFTGAYRLLRVDNPGYATYAVGAVDNPYVVVRVRGYTPDGSRVGAEFRPVDLYNTNDVVWSPRGAFLLRYDTTNNVYAFEYSPYPWLAYSRAEVSLEAPPGQTATLLVAYVELIEVYDMAAFEASLTKVLGTAVRAIPSPAAPTRRAVPAPLPVP